MGLLDFVREWVDFTWGFVILEWDFRVIRWDWGFLGSRKLLEIKDFSKVRRSSYRTIFG